jgi:uncharacterized OB-fold protein
MKRRVELDYSLGEGWLAPWLDGLRTGKAVASTCPACGAAQFPPLRVCPACRVPSDGWRTLSGGATVLFRTTGADGDVAMARFDGAIGAAIARVDALPERATRAILAPCPDDLPILALIAEPET